MFSGLLARRPTGDGNLNGSLVDRKARDAMNAAAKGRFILVFQPRAKKLDSMAKGGLNLLRQCFPATVAGILPEPFEPSANSWTLGLGLPTMKCVGG